MGPLDIWLRCKGCCEFRVQRAIEVRAQMEPDGADVSKAVPSSAVKRLVPEYGSRIAHL